MDIRDLSPADIPAAAAIWDEADLTRPWNPAERDIQQALAGHTSTVLGAFEAESLIGTVLVGHDGHRGWIYYLAVAQNHRGTGLGRSLMTAAEDWLRERGAVKVQLMVRASNSTVLDFYDHLGYADAEVQVLGKWLI